MTEPTTSPYSDVEIALAAQAEKLQHQETASSHFWRLFNPQNDALLHLRIEPPSLVTLAGSHTPHPSDEPPVHHAKRRAVLRNLRPLIWAVKIVLLPMSATAFALWCLLLWLLKDAELLEAQRDRSETGGSTSGDRSVTGPRMTTSPLESHATFQTADPAFVADVELLAVSSDGTVVAACSARSDLAFWKGRDLQPTIIKLTNVLGGLDGAQVRVTAISLSHDGTICTVGTSEGLAVQWDIQAGMMSRSSHRAEIMTVVVAAHFLPSRVEPSHEPKDIGLSTRQTLSPTLIIYENGTATLWRESGSIRVPLLSRSVRAPVAWCQSEDQQLTLVRPQAGCLEIFNISVLSSATEWLSSTIADANDTSETIICLTIETIQMDQERNQILAFVTASGRISAYDMTRKRLLCSIETDREDITRVGLSSVPLIDCKQCGHLEPDSFLLVCSAGSSVDVYRAIAMLVPNRCSCSTSQLHRSGGSKNTLREKSQHQRSRTSSLTTATLSPTLRPNLGVGPPFNHGPHSRRASELDSKPRPSLETVASDTTDLTLDGFGIDSLLTNAAPQTDSASRSPLDITGAIKLVKIDSIPNERGVWELLKTTLVGVRRKPRVPLNPAQRNNRKSDPAAQVRDSLLSRWEAWSFDLLGHHMFASPILRLEDSQTMPSISEIQERLNDDGSLFRRSAGMRRLVELSNGTAATAIARAATLPSPRPNGVPLLPFTRLSVACSSGSTLVVGFGNMPGVLVLFGEPRVPDNGNSLSPSRKKDL